jgi:hypothetical protein
MRRIIDVDEVQRELDRAAHDAKHGTADVRAGRNFLGCRIPVHEAAGKELPMPRSADSRRPRKARRV